MRLDYKSPLKHLRLRSFLSRRIIHSALGFIAAICLTIALLPGKPENGGMDDAQALSHETTASDTATEATSISIAKHDSNIGNTLNGNDNNHSANDGSNQANPSEKSSLSSKKNKKNDSAATNENEKDIENTKNAVNSKEVVNTKGTANSNSKNEVNKESAKSKNAAGIKNATNTKEATNINDAAASAKDTAASTKDKAKSSSSTDIAAKASSTNTSEASNTASNTISADWQTIKIQKNDTLAKVFQRHGLSQNDLKKIMASDKVKPLLSTIQPGQTLKLQITDKKQVEGLNLDISPGNSLSLARKGNEYEVSHKELPVEKKIAFGKGEIHASLVSSAKRAGLDNNIVAQMVEIFGGNIDFSLDLKPHDTFRVLFEQRCLPDGEKVKTGNILAAELINGGKKLQAIRYTDKSGQTGYFSPEGFGLNQAFLRSPVNYTSISSGFGKRRHPIYHKMRAHKGVDYAAPHGTAVQATGAAKVIFAGTRSGYGKVVELQHGARYTTLYAHLSRFAKNVKAGASIKQGEVIGYVGKTGLATGPHLHYEFRIDGIHRDPLTVNLPRSKLIEDANKRHFLAHAKEMLRLMDVHDQKINVARNVTSVEFPLNE